MIGLLCALAYSARNLCLTHFVIFVAQEAQDEIEAANKEKPSALNVILTYQYIGFFLFLSSIPFAVEFGAGHNWPPCAVIVIVVARFDRNCNSVVIQHFILLAPSFCVHVDIHYYWIVNL